jgi:hypothetical protein
MTLFTLAQQKQIQFDYQRCVYHVSRENVNILSQLLLFRPFFSHMSAISVFACDEDELPEESPLRRHEFLTRALGTRMLKCKHGFDFESTHQS